MYIRKNLHSHTYCTNKPMLNGFLGTYYAQNYTSINNRLIPNPLSADSVNKVSYDSICFDGLVTVCRLAKPFFELPFSNFIAIDLKQLRWKG